MKKLLCTIFGAVLFTALSMNVFAAEKISKVTIEEDAKSVTFNVSFDKEGEYSLYAESPDGVQYDGEMLTENTGVIKVDKNAFAGDWRIHVISNDDYLPRVTIKMSLNVNTADHIDNEIKVARDIVGLKYYFVNKDFKATWTDASVGKINIKLVDTNSSEVIDETTVDEGIMSYTCPIPNHVDKISFFIVPATSVGVDGAGEAYTVDVVHGIDANVEFSPKKEVNTTSVLAKASGSGAVKYRIYSNGKMEKEIDANGKEMDLEIPLTEGENEAVICAVDKDGNEFTFSNTYIKDTVLPVISIKNGYDGLKTYDNTIKIEGNASDFNELYINDTLITAEENGNFSFDYYLIDGRNDITIKAVDNAGNEAFTGATVIKQVKDDNMLVYIIIACVFVFILVIVGVLVVLLKRKSHKTETPLVETVSETKEVVTNITEENINTENETEDETEENDNEDEDNEKVMKKEKMIKNAIDLIIWGICAYILFFHIVFLGIVVSGSMEPTISNRSFVFGFRAAYIFSKPERGDIVFIDSEEENMTLGKRIIGLPGEQIEFIDGYVYIDGKKLDESEYIGDDVETNAQTSFSIPEDCYFVMGDNRENSFDSRFWAEPYVAKRELKGKCLFHIDF